MFAAILLETLIDEQNNLEKLPAGTTLKIIAEDDAVIPVSLHKALSRTKLKEEYTQSPGPLTDRFWLGFLIGTLAAGNEQGYFVSGETEEINSIMSGKLRVVPSLKNIVAPQKRVRRSPAAAKAEQPAPDTENAAPKRRGSKPAAEAKEEKPAPVPAEIMPKPENTADESEKMTKEEEDMMHERFLNRLKEVEPEAADEWAKILIAVQDSTSASGASRLLKSIVPEDLLGIATKAVTKDFKELKRICGGV